MGSTPNHGRSQNPVFNPTLVVVMLGHSQRSDVHTELRFAVEPARPRLRPAGLGPRAPTGFDGHSNISKSCAICPVHAHRRPAPSGLLYAGGCERERLAERPRSATRAAVTRGR